MTDIKRFNRVNLALRYSNREIEIQCKKFFYFQKLVFNYCETKQLVVSFLQIDF